MSAAEALRAAHAPGVTVTLDGEGLVLEVERGAMVPFVLLLGVIATLVGLAAIAFGIPINEFGLGNRLILAGTTAASAGFIVLALAAVLRAIERSGRELAPVDEPAALPAERTGAATDWPRPAAIAPPRGRPASRARRDAPCRTTGQVRFARRGGPGTSAGACTATCRSAPTRRARSGPCARADANRAAARTLVATPGRNPQPCARAVRGG